MPPVALNVCEYFTPTSALLRPVVVIANVATGVTVTVEVDDLVLSATLVAVTTALVSVVTSGAV
jgi:hypothetical protein